MTSARPTHDKPHAASVHEAQATRDSTFLKTCEFIHATFGEYLTGLLVAQEVNDLADTAGLLLTVFHQALQRRLGTLAP